MKKFFSLKEHVYEYIAGQISSGSLHPEEKISENAICQELGISRTPVREALIQLASEGIIENVPRKGFVVHALDEKTSMELYSVIGVLDGLSAGLACPRLTAKHIGNLLFFADSMDVAINGGHYEMYYKQQEEFHELYLQQCGNASLIVTLLQQKRKLLNNGYSIENEEKKREILLETNMEHRHIIEFFQENDAEGVENYVRRVHWHPQKALMDMLKA